MNNTFIICLLIIFSQTLRAPPESISNRPAYVPGEVLLQYKSTAISGKSGKSIPGAGAGKTIRVKTRNGNSVLETVKELQKNSAVEFAQPNFIKYAHKVPDDPDFGQLWGMQNTGQTILDPHMNSNNPGFTGSDMAVTEAWDISTNCSNVIIAVLDSGVAYTHPELRDNMWDGSGDCRDPDNNPVPGGCPKHGYDTYDIDLDPYDLFGHGTHVAGTIGAHGNNGQGVAGVCWRAQIMAVRVLGMSGTGSTTSVADGIRFAVNNGANIINMSLGGVGDDQMERDAMAYARERGVLIVLSAGNDYSEIRNERFGGSTSCINSLDNVLCVAALDQKFELANFSNYGKKYVDTAAPGQNVLSSMIGPFDLERYKTGDVLHWTNLTGSEWQFFSTGDRSFFSLGADTAEELGGTHRTYTTIDTADLQAGGLRFNFNVRLDDSGDSFSIYTKSGTGEPFSTGKRVYRRTKAYLNYFEPISADLAGCNGGLCSIGVEYISDGDAFPDAGYGVGFDLDNLRYITTGDGGRYQVTSGTSMSAPMVAGLAGLVWHYNPNFTYRDVKAAIENSGLPMDSLKEKLSSGKAANAANALKYISAPREITVVVE